MSRRKVGRGETIEIVSTKRNWNGRQTINREVTCKKPNGLTHTVWKDGPETECVLTRRELLPIQRGTLVVHDDEPWPNTSQGPFGFERRNSIRLSTGSQSEVLWCDQGQLPSPEGFGPKMVGVDRRRWVLSRRRLVSEWEDVLNYVHLRSRFFYGILSFVFQTGKTFVTQEKGGQNWGRRGLCKTF